MSDETQQPVSGSEAFHIALQELSNEYRILCKVKEAGWSRTNEYTPKPEQRGTAVAYSEHYETVFHEIPTLTFSLLSEVVGPKQFLDLGAAPGGFSLFLLKQQWCGIGVTLDEAVGGIPMEVEESGRYRIVTADVLQEAEFHQICNEAVSTYLSKPPRQEHQQASSTPPPPHVDFVNLGIVIDQVVKHRRQVKSKFSETLHTQMRVASQVLAPGGTLMFVLGLTRWLEDCIVKTLDAMSAISTQGVHILTTMYTKSSGRKQMYVVCLGVHGLTTEVVEKIRMIWCDDSRKRSKDSLEEARTITARVMQSVKGFSKFCETLAGALESHTQ
eukprot:PhF_6_TR41704/c0_g1_i3/m.63270